MSAFVYIRKDEKEIVSIVIHKRTMDYIVSIFAEQKFPQNSELIKKVMDGYYTGLDTFDLVNLTGTEFMDFYLAFINGLNCAIINRNTSPDVDKMVAIDVHISWWKYIIWQFEMDPRYTEVSLEKGVSP